MVTEKSISSDERTFENTWLPRVVSKELTASKIVAALKFGVARFDDIPEHIKPYVLEELRKERKTREERHLNKIL